MDGIFSLFAEAPIGLIIIAIATYSARTARNGRTGSRAALIDLLETIALMTLYVLFIWNADEVRVIDIVILPLLSLLAPGTARQEEAVASQTEAIVDGLNPTSLLPSRLPPAKMANAALAKGGVRKRKRIRKGIGKLVIREDARCGVCGETVGNNGVENCGRCDTPHHADCWQFAGQCSVYACGFRKRRQELETTKGNQP